MTQLSIDSTDKLDITVHSADYIGHDIEVTQEHLQINPDLERIRVTVGNIIIDILQPSFGKDA
jgi:hypothetical protein